MTVEVYTQPISGSKKESLETMDVKHNGSAGFQNELSLNSVLNSNLRIVREPY